MPAQEHALTIGQPLTIEGRTALRASASLYIKHVEAVAVKTKELGKERESAQLQREADALRLDLLGTEEDPSLGLLAPARAAEPLAFSGAQTKAIAKGLEFYLHNLKAAKGTLIGLGETELAETFEEKYHRIEQHLVPMFQEQGSLPLPTGKPERSGKSLKEIADEEADAEDRRQEAEERKGAIPIGTVRKSSAKVGR